MKILTFRMADVLHGLELPRVAAVARPSEIEESPEWAELPWLDLAVLLGYGGAGGGTAVVIQGGEGGVVVRVDRTGEVMELPDDSPQAVPSLVESRVVAGVVDHGGELIVLLDAEALAREAREGRGGA